MSFLSTLRDKLLSILPVIGLHDGFEAELLLAKRKPLGWISFITHLSLDDPDLHPTIRTQLENQERLEQAVRQGHLISHDVITDAETKNPRIFRHYAQPWNKKNLDLAIHFNQRRFNRQPIAEKEPDLGKILGYRKRDRLFWDLSAFIPGDVCQFVTDLGRKAYQAEELRRAEKENKRPNPRT